MTKTVDKRTQIILAAMKLFIENDIQATPMTAIAKAAHTGMSAIYSYFRSKEVLINSIFIYIKERQYHNLRTEPLSGTVNEQFQKYYTEFSLYLIGHPYEFYFLSQFEHSPIITPETRARELKLYEPVTRLICEGQQQGLIKNISTQELLEFLNGGILRFMRCLLTTEREKQGQLLENQLAMAWDAVTL